MNTRHLSFSRLLGCFPLLLLSLVAQAGNALGAEVEWRSDYGKARKEALEKGRPLVIDFGTENCYWCKQLEQRTFIDPAVVALLNERCIPLHIDAARSPDLIEKMNIQNYPTLVYASPEGRILGYQEGFIEAPVFREQIQRAVNTVSTPEWMTRDFEEASKAAAQKEYPRALSLLKSIVEDGKERQVQTKARRLIQEVEQHAAEQLAAAKQKADKGDTAEAMKSAGEVTKQFAGADAAREAKEWVATLTSRTQVGDQQRKDRAHDLLAQAREDYRTQQFLCCLDRCEVLIAQYPELPEGAEAAQLTADIKSNAEWAKLACDQMSDRLGVLYLALADTCLKKGQPQQAVHYLERVVQNFPASRHAEAAQVRLSQIQGQPLSPSVDFKK
jgi:thioredoxin-like negative regulator of GroEL